MKIAIAVIVIFFSFGFIGCASSLSETSDSVIIITDKITVGDFGGEKCWIATGYGESVKMSMAHDIATMSARHKIAKYLANRPDDKSFVYEMRDSRVIRQHVEKVGEYWVAKVVIAANYAANPMK